MKNRRSSSEEIDDIECSSGSSKDCSDDSSSDAIYSDVEDLPFTRKFLNLDMTTCWLNSCLQLILTGLDYHEQCNVFHSELGLQLLKLKSQYGKEFLDATTVKNILVEAEDTRIATRMSTLTAEIKNQDLLSKRMTNLQDLHLNLKSGEQCVRDFFLCLGENSSCWPDVNACFSFNLEHQTTCLSCNHVNTSNNTHFFVEFDVPPKNSSFNLPIEEFLNNASLVGSSCDVCKKKVQVEIKNQIINIKETEFITVILRRGVSALEGFTLNQSKVDSTADVFVR